MKRLISALSSLCLAATSLLGAFPGITASAATVKADAPANTIVYDLIPQGKDYTPAAVDSKDNNVVKVTPGEELAINWTVKNDQGTAGLQMTFDFSGVEFVKAKKGSAYAGTPQFNSKAAATTGEVNYAMADKDGQTAEDDAVIYTFTVKAPESGKATVGMKTGSNINNKVVPTEDGKEHAFLFHGLTLDAGGEDTSKSTSSDTTKGTSATTKGTSATTKGSEVDVTNTIIYNLVPASKDCTKVADNMTGNNTMSAEAGEEIVINWTVKKDQGTAGLQMSFDFSGVEFVKAKKGSAYAGTPQFNSKNAATTGEVNYAMADKDGQTAEDDAVIYSFTVKAPASGSATIAPKGNDNKVVPTEDGKEHKFLFHGLTINVGGGEGTTKGTTASTKGSEVDITKTIIYNLAPASKDYTAVADNMTGNNTMNATAGEEIVINWTVKQDQGTAGLQMSFDFSGVEFVKAKKGSAYAGTPQFNSKNAATTGEVNYAMADKDGQTAEDDAVIYSFTVKAPASGSATIAPMGNDNKAVPTEDGKEHKFLFHGLTINVGGGEGTTKGSTASTEGSKVDITNTIIYNLVPASGDFTAVADDMTGNNTMIAAAGEELTINWTVKQDQGTAGLQMTFDFSGVEYVKAKKGSAYAGTPQFNAKDAKTTGEVNYAMADKDGQTADDGAVIYSFTIKAPESGSATIGMKTGSNINNKVVPTEDGKEHKFLFHGLTITIGSQTTDETSSSQKSDTTSDSKSTNTTESTKTTATTADVPAGSASWKIGKENAAAGADVKVPVTVSGDQGTAGIVAEFGFDTKLKFNGITWGEGYTGEATLNSKNAIAVWADANGADQKAKDNAVVLYLNFTAPAEAGTYDVTFKGLEVTNTAGKALTLTKDNGSVTVTGKVGSSNWTIGKETVAANAKVKVPVTVSGDEGTAGINVQFKADKALKFEGIEWAKGYTGDATINDKQLIAVWGADANQKAKDNDVVLYLNFTAPAAAGEYPVEFAALEVCDENGAWLKVTKQNGAVIVTDPKAGSATWIIGEEVAEAGAQVKVPVTVQGDTGSAGFNVEFANDSKLTFTGVEWGKGYTGKATINTNKKIVVWADANGANQKAANDAVVLYLLYTAPDQAGEYDVTFKDLAVSNEDGAFLALTKQDGKVIVKDPNAGSANWIIGKETCDKGATVKVPVTVKGDTGTAGFNVEFAYDQNLTFTGFEWAGKAYTGNATLNINKQIVVWADVNGENQKAADDAVVLYLVFTAPDVEGTYPVRFVNFDSSDKAGVALVIEKENGWVKVGTTPTESTSESTQSTASTSATVSTSVNSNESTVSTASTSSNGSTESSVSTSATVSTQSTASTESNASSQNTGSTSSTVSTASTSNNQSGESTVSSDATASDSSKTETSTTPVANVGNVVYQIAKVKAAAGTTAKVPVYVWYDTGTAGFTMEFAVPDGFKISGIEYGDAYTSANGEFTWDNGKRVLVWASADGANQTAKVGSTIATLLIDVPSGIPAGIEYPVTFVKDSVSASDTERNLLKHQEIDGSITIDTEVTKESTTVSTSATVSTSNNGSTESTVSTSATVSTQSTVSTSNNGSTESTVSTSATVSTESNVSTSNNGSTESTVSTSATVSTSETNPNSETTPKVVTSYKFTFEPPTRVNYWSHDTRTFKDSNGLKGLAASLTVTKFYINDEGYFVNEKGVELVHVKYDAATGEIPGGVKPFETKTLDATAYTHPKETEDGPKKVWENEIKAQFGENYTAEQELKATHANKYPVKAYYFPAEQSDPDFNINNGEPVEFGEFKIYIGVKGDVNLDNVVSAEDPQLVLTYYTEKVLAFNDSALINPEKKVDPEFEGEDGLCFYLGNVAFRDKDGKQVDPPVLDVEDAQNILNYYTEKYVTLIDTTTWESIVGYDLIDEFYGGVKEG